MLEKQVSEQEIRIYEAVREHGGWLTAREIAVKADVADRAARNYASSLEQHGVFEVVTAFGGHKYRLRPELPPRAVDYVGQLESAMRHMGA